MWGQGGGLTHGGFEELEHVLWMDEYASLVYTQTSDPGFSSMGSSVDEEYPWTWNQKVKPSLKNASDSCMSAVLSPLTV